MKLRIEDLFPRGLLVLGVASCSPAAEPAGAEEHESSVSGEIGSSDTRPDPDGGSASSGDSSRGESTQGVVGSTSDATSEVTGSTSSEATTGPATDEGSSSLSSSTDADGSTGDSEDDLGEPMPARNPLIWADVPDPSVVRVGDTYYMSSTTMHMNPGVPIMRSRDLARWDIAGYAYERLSEGPSFSLENGANEYSRGTWASSIRYHDSTFHVLTFSYSTGSSYLFRTDDVEGGAWTRTTLGLYHDPSLFFDDDGRAFVVWGANDIRIVELRDDLSGPRPGGVDQMLIRNSSSVTGASQFYVQSEGAHMQKIDGRYYVSLISWPAGSMRSQLVFRSDALTGPYEGRVVLQDDGVAQGGFVDTPGGDWYALLHRDYGSVGRIPYLVPVTWVDGWPVFGTDGQVPEVLDFSTRGQGAGGIVSSDEFERSDLRLEWQWNHNPDDDAWSLTERPGYLRLRNDRIDTRFTQTQNTLTQRAFGPASSGVVALDTQGMVAGDYAGLGALQAHYGFVGVHHTGAEKTVVMIDGDADGERTIASFPLQQDVVHLRVDMDFGDRRDVAEFLYSLDGEAWTSIGEPLRMSYDLAHFVGYRFALFSFATQTTGGHADFDFFHVEERPR